jgi:alkylation response protein AidB-like acyl-CoA dehydrogenase
MPYSFEPYLTAVPTNWYQDDPQLKRLLSHYAGDIGPDAKTRLNDWGEAVAGRLRLLAEASARTECRPRLEHFDAFNHRIDAVILPESTLQALAEVGGRQHLGAVNGDPFVFYSQVYLYAQNGEAGVACSMACTDGMVRALEDLGDRAEHRRAVSRIRSSTAERLYHGAQFVTEIQGGSDVPANELQAVAEGDRFRLFGQKWFCSNINADYFLVTARPEGAPEGGKGVALFLMPAYAEDGGRQRNGYTIDRLKEKLGTRELATAEVTFDGALAYPLGPLDRGIPNVLKYVLVTSRFYCALAAVGFMRQAERIIAAYTDFRSAFGSKLNEFPLVRQTVSRIGSLRRQNLAVLFELLRLWQETSKGSQPAGIDFRIMMSLAKAVITARTTEHLHEAMMLLGGNGIEEIFSPLPRLYRDAVILETWEGPHNVLFSQALRDMVRFKLEPAEFVPRIAGQNQGGLARDLENLLAAADDPQTTVLFADLAYRLVDAFGRRLVSEIQ